MSTRPAVLIRRTAVCNARVYAVIVGAADPGCPADSRLRMETAGGWQASPDLALTIGASKFPRACDLHAVELSKARARCADEDVAKAACASAEDKAGTSSNLSRPPDSKVRIA